MYILLNDVNMTLKKEEESSRDTARGYDKKLEKIPK